MRLAPYTCGLVLAAQFMCAQQFRTDGIATIPGDSIKVDLSTITDLDGASVTIHNSASSSVSLPQIKNSATLWPYNADAVIGYIQPHGTDQEVAIQTWQFVMNHMSHGCSAGTTTSQGTATFATDPMLLVADFGFGCCDQADRVLLWLWQRLGYATRLAVFDFHTVPEVHYDGAWHLLDPDHRVYYLANDNRTIASVEQILADPSLVSRTADANGNDPLGTNAATMAEWYAQNAGNLRYITSGYLDDSGLSLVLRPHEQLRFDSNNRQDSIQLFSEGANSLGFNDIHSARSDWDLSFGDPDWPAQAYSADGVGVVADLSGASSLISTSSSPGQIVYQQSSIFPAIGLTVAAQISSSNGSLDAYFSSDGILWSDPVTFRNVTDISSFQQAADLSVQATGHYSYFVKIELHDGIRVHKLRISPLVQVSRFLFPSLAPGISNEFAYSDSSVSSQQREVHVITRIPQGNAVIRGMQAFSLISEDPIRSLALDHGAANLVDGDLDSIAAPGAGHLDYQVQLTGLYEVTGVSIDWNRFGTDAGYVQNWSIFGREGNNDWRLLASGGFPGQNTSDIRMDTLATDLRIVADGSNPIGVYEFRAFGRSVHELPVSSVQTKQSGGSHSAADLSFNSESAFSRIPPLPPDGNPPGDPVFTLQQQVSFPVATHFSAIEIDWGIFGTQPPVLTNWLVAGRNGSANPWTTLSQGSFPNAAKSFTGMDFVGTDLKILVVSATRLPASVPVRLFGGAVLSNLTASSSVPEIFNFPAANLVDLNSKTLAYPGATSLDYTVDPSQDTYIDALQLVWNSFGTIPGYINAWQLLGLPSNGTTWQVVARGNSPGATATMVPVGSNYRKLRVTAQSQLNFIGIYEMQIFGGPAEQASAAAATRQQTAESSMIRATSPGSVLARSRKDLLHINYTKADPLDKSAHAQPGTGPSSHKQEFVLRAVIP